MKVRVFLACLTCRILRSLLRLFGRGGTALPGKAALKVCPSLLRQLGRDVETVIVTGTNGKTTTAGMLRLCWMSWESLISPTGPGPI